MKIKKIDTGLALGLGITIIVALFHIVGNIRVFPIPRGNKVNNNYYTYYQNIFGIYYISIEYAIGLVNHGRWGYLKDVDKTSFVVLSASWAKDDYQVWYGDQPIDFLDVKSFHINEHGVAVDKNNVYIHDYSTPFGCCNIKPSQSGIDVATAEYFVYRRGYLKNEWMRDKNYVYLCDKKIEVDRNTFQTFGEDWFIDKDFLYRASRNESTRHWDLHCIDSLQNPIETGRNRYFRNGRNIIFNDRIILEDIDVKRFEAIGEGKYRINNMLFLWGEPFLKDSLDVDNARFYWDGHIAADNENVYFGHEPLDDIDALTFRQIDDDTFEDKNYIYTYKGGPDYLFKKKKKKKKK